MDAGEGLLAQVDPHVPLQVGLLDELLKKSIYYNKLALKNYKLTI